MTYDEIRTAWNAQADDGNRWHSLSEAEKVEWAAIHAAAKERASRIRAQEEAEDLKGRIAQAMLVPIPRVELIEVAELSDTERGAGGFGSTGA